MASEAFEKWASSDPKAGYLFGERAAARAAWDESRRQAVETCVAQVEAAAQEQRRLGYYAEGDNLNSLAARLRRLA